MKLVFTESNKQRKSQLSIEVKFHHGDNDHCSYLTISEIEIADKEEILELIEAINTVGKDILSYNINNIDESISPNMQLQSLGIYNETLKLGMKNGFNIEIPIIKDLCYRNVYAPISVSATTYYDSIDDKFYNVTIEE